MAWVEQADQSTRETIKSNFAALIANTIEMYTLDNGRVINVEIKGVLRSRISLSQWGAILATATCTATSS